MAPKTRGLKTRAGISKNTGQRRSNRITTRVPQDMGPKYARKRPQSSEPIHITSPTPSPEPSPVPSPIPSPPAPPPVPSWVTKRLNELAEGKLKIYHERGFILDEPNGTYRNLYVTDWVTTWGWEKLAEHPTVQPSIKPCKSLCMIYSKYLNI